jgi:hypothetical protein
LSTLALVNVGGDANVAAQPGRGGRRGSIQKIEIVAQQEMGVGFGHMNGDAILYRFQEKRRACVRKECEIESGQQPANACPSDLVLGYAVRPIFQEAEKGIYVLLCLDRELDIVGHAEELACGM